MRFNKGMYYQLLQWVQVQSGWFALSSLPTKELDMSCLRYMEKKPINTVYLWACNLDGKCSSFFKELPFSTVSEILLCNFLNTKVVAKLETTYYSSEKGSSRT